LKKSGAARTKHKRKHLNTKAGVAEGPYREGALLHFFGASFPLANIPLGD